VHRRAPEAFPIGIGRVSADARAVRLATPQGQHDGLRVTRVATARDVRDVGEGVKLLGLSAKLQPRSVSRMAVSVDAMAASRQPPLLCSALASEPRAERSSVSAVFMFGWVAQPTAPGGPAGTGPEYSLTSHPIAKARATRETAAMGVQALLVMLVFLIMMVPRLSACRRRRIRARFP
jgi:hypothetical protein